VVSWNSFASSPKLHTPMERLGLRPQPRCSTGGTESAGGAGRSTPTLRGTGTLGGVSLRVTISPRGAPGYRTRPISVPAVLGLPAFALLRLAPRPRSHLRGCDRNCSEPREHFVSSSNVILLHLRHEGVS